MERFENLIAWQKARIFTRKIYEATTQGRFSQDAVLRDQIRRSSIAIMSNVAEGYEKGTAAEFCHSMNVARGALGEVHSQLYVALDLGYIRQSEFDDLQPLCEEISRILGSLRQSRLTK